MHNIIPKALLLVRNDQEMNHLYGQALDIAGLASMEEGNIVVMMHEPSAEQLEDIDALSKGEGKRVALIGGQFGLMVNVLRALDKKGFIVVEAKTDRVSEEVVQPDGSVKKVSVFKHRGLRRLN